VENHLIRGQRIDMDVGERFDKREEPQECAFIFRKVMTSSNMLHHSEIDILSHDLIQLLEKHVTHFPKYIWEEKHVQLFAPFAPLIYEWNHLVQLSNKGHSFYKYYSSGVKDDLKLLLAHIEKCDELVRYFATRDSNQTSRLVTFDTLWTLFAPGTKVFATPYMDALQMFEVESPHTTLSDVEPLQNLGAVASTRVRSAEGNSSSWRSIICCGLDFNGTHIVRVPYEFRIPKFPGARAITSLPCYPVEYQSQIQEEITSEYVPPKDLMRDLLISRAKKFRILARPIGNRMFLYRGPIYSDGFGIIKSSTNEQVNEKVCLKQEARSSQN
jgi:hypothetical protein